MKYKRPEMVVKEYKMDSVSICLSDTSIGDGNANTDRPIIKPIPGGGIIVNK